MLLNRRRRRNTTPAILGLSGLRGLYLYAKKMLGNKVFDERSGLGDARPLQDGMALEVNGTNQSVEFGNASELQITGALTITGWINFADVNSARGVISKYTATGSDRGYGIQLPTDGTLTFLYQSAPTPFNSGQIVGTPSPVDDGTWKHFICEFSPSNFARIHIDGVQVAEDLTVPASLNNSGEPLRIGRLDTNYGDGKIFDIRVFNSILSAEDKALTMEAAATSVDPVFHAKLEGDFLDSSGNENHGTGVNSPTTYTGSDVPYSFLNQLGYSDGENLLLYSEDVTNAVWTKTKATLTGTTTPSPDGDYDVPLYSISTSGFVLQDTFSIDPGGAGTNRVWLKANVAGTMGLRQPGGTSGLQNTSINVTTEWQLFEASTEAALTDNGRILIDNRPTGGGGIVGLQLAIYQAQQYRGTEERNYARTEGSQAEGIVPRVGETDYDVLGNLVRYKGTAPNNKILTNSNGVGFNGVDEYGQSSSTLSKATDELSICFWQKYDGTDPHSPFVNCRSGNNGFQFWLGSDGGLDFAYYDSSTIQVETFATGSDYEDSVAHHFTVTVNSGGDLKYYVDEILIHETTIDHDTFGAHTLLVGYDGSGNYGEAQGFADLRIFTKALTASEIKFVKTNGELGTNPATTELEVHVPFSEGGGSVAYDKSPKENHISLVNPPSRVLQDVYHQNVIDGYSLYEHASLPDIFVPYGSDGNPLSITPPSGYTKTSDHPAGAFHNGAETDIDVQNPDAPEAEGIESPWDYNDARVAPLYHRSDDGNSNADRFVDLAAVPTGADLTTLNNFIGA